MRLFRIRAVMLAAAGTVLLAPSGRAQTLGSGTLSGSFELGGRTAERSYTDQQLGKFLEYKAVPNGAVLENVAVRYVTLDSLFQVQALGRRVGALDQSLWFRATHPGLFDLQVRSDRIPHTFSTTARFLGSETSPGVYVLPNPRPDTATLNRSAFIGPIRTVWDPVKVSLVVTPSESWDSKVDYVHITKTGGRPMGMAFGGSSNNAREIIEPIDQTLQGLRVAQSYTGDRYTLMGSYELSAFHNALSSVTSDNPLLVGDTPTAGSSRGRTALAPSNIAHTVSATGALNLPFDTRVTTTGTFGWWRQNEPYIPVTINSALVDPRIGTGPVSLGGVALTSNFAASFTSRPFRMVDVTGHFRSYVFRDHATGTTVPLLVVNDRSISPADSGGRDPYRKDDADIGASLRLPLALVASAGYAVGTMNLDSLERNVKHYRETTPRASLDFTGIDWATLRATYSKSYRRTSDYHATDGLTFTTFQRYDLADRDRELLELMADITPWDPLTISTTWQLGHDRYPSSTYGVVSDKSSAAGLDLSYAVSTRVSLGAGYMHETYDDLAHNLFRTGTQLANPTYEWYAHNTDRVVTTSADAKVVVIPGKLELGGRYEHSRARFVMLANNPTTPSGGTATQNTQATATDFPAVLQTLEPATAYAQYSITPSWAVVARYQQELFDQNNFQTLGLQPATGNYVFLGNNYMNYNVRYITIAFSYRPLPISFGRSTL